MTGTCIMTGYVHPHNHPHTQLKKSGIPHTHTHTQTHTQSMKGFPVKTEIGSDNTHGEHVYLSSLPVIRDHENTNTLYILNSIINLTYFTLR